MLIFAVPTVSADTANPQVKFSNGLSLVSNELSDDMISPKGLGLMFDNNPKTSWKFQERDKRYGRKSAQLKINSEKYPLTKIFITNKCNGLNKIRVTNEVGSALGTLTDEGEGNYSILLDNENDANVHFEGSNICIPSMNIYSNDVELTNAPFISSSGGSYSEVSFYANKKWVVNFKPGNVANYYYLEDGGYACFDLMLEFGPPAGIRVYNTKTLAKLDIVKGEYLEPSTIKWSGNIVTGILVKPENDWQKKKFRIVVSFP
jgi:hypothetical protein